MAIGGSVGDEMTVHSLERALVSREMSSYRKLFSFS